MADQLLAHIGKTIRAIRQAKKLSMEEVAFAANISYFYFSQIEHGQRNLTIKYLYQIASALSVKPTALLPGENVPAPAVPPPKKTSLLKTLRQLTAQIKDL